MRMVQVSFSSGEISPLLHARADLARYSTGLAELRNMIVLPQGGVTRRSGFRKLGGILSSLSAGERLIPFEYNSTDNAVLEFGDRLCRVWSDEKASALFETPYDASDVKDLRYVQSGNVMFFAHRKYKPQMLRRKSLADWELSELEYRGGAWISGTEWNSRARLRLTGSKGKRYVYSDVSGVFTSGLIGTLLKLEYAVEGKTETFQSQPSPYTAMSGTYEVKGTLNVQTAGDWSGVIRVSRSADGGETWVTVRQYTRTDYETQGQWDFTLTEADAGIIYRVEAEHIPQSDDKTDISEWPVWAASVSSTGAQGSKTAATVTLSVSGFLKEDVYRITGVNPGMKEAVLEQAGLNENMPGYSGDVSLWSLGAWGIEQGYPGAVCMYQDRLVFAGSPLQPQTLWMSRTGDYADFSASEPVRDDDAVNITLAGTKADRIHSLISSSDLLAFTTGGEWRIRGYGDSGAITPAGIVAHEQTNIGTKEIQPILTNGRIILVQTEGQKVYALGYDLNTDGYAGSELSILSSHIFEGKEIIGMAYQQTPNSLLWFVLSDGTCAVCTYNPEQEVIGWSRHEVLNGVRCVCELKDKLFALVKVGASEYVMRQYKGTYQDEGTDYESVMRTLRLTQNAEGYTVRKLAARVKLSAIRSRDAWICPGDYDDEAHNWERRRKVKLNGTEYIEDSDVQLDNGFSDYGSIQIRAIGSVGLTVAAVTPVMTAGG